jgi:hypothetical protein
LIFQFLWIIYFSPKAFFSFLLLKKYWQCYLKFIFFSVLAAKWKFKVNPESKTTATRPHASFWFQCLDEKNDDSL